MKKLLILLLILHYSAIFAQEQKHNDQFSWEGIFGMHIQYMETQIEFDTLETR